VPPAQPGPTRQPTPPAPTSSGLKTPPTGASISQGTTPATGLAPATAHPLKPLMDAGCRIAAGDPQSLACPPPAMERCEQFRRESKVRSCAPLR
jgi:hypothetical protein